MYCVHPGARCGEVRLSVGQGGVGNTGPMSEGVVSQNLAGSVLRMLTLGPKSVPAAPFHADAQLRGVKKRWLQRRFSFKSELRDAASEQIITPLASGVDEFSHRWPTEWRNNASRQKALVATPMRRQRTVHAPPKQRQCIVSVTPMHGQWARRPCELSYFGDSTSAWCPPMCIARQ